MMVRDGYSEFLWTPVELDKYENLCYLHCPQGGYLTKDNIFRVNNGEQLTDEEFKQYFRI